MQEQENSQVFDDAFDAAPDYSHIPSGETLDWTPEKEEEEALTANAPPPEEVSQRDQGISSEAVKDGGLLGSLGNALNSARGGEGSGGAENPLESLIGDAKNWIDDNFQGNQSTREEINDTMNKEQEDRQNFIDSNPALNLLDDTVGEVGRIGIGAVTGAAESIFGSAEVLGDTIKSIPSLVGLAEADGKETPWSNEYEWARWNLGSDEYGAQTGIGKVAQGFGEFGLLMYATGGFRAVQGVGQAWKAAQGLGKAKVLATTAAKEGMYGMAADFIDGTAGSDNLTTIIRDNFPDILPDWMEALAVDDGDGPLANGIKNTLEGFGLGAIVGAVGAPLAGMAAVRKLPKDAPQNVKEEAFVEASQKHLLEQTDSTVPDTAATTVQRLEKIGDQTHLSRYRTVIDQYEKGIPVTHDDVANVFPELFTPGNRQLPNDFNGAIYRAVEELSNDAGFTRNPFTGQQAPEGFSVAIDAEPLTKMDPEAIQAFMQKNSDLLSREDVYLGAWKDPSNGVVEIELSRVLPDRNMAEILGTAFDQKGIYDNAEGVFIPTGGVDELRKTKNGHLKGPMSAPSHPKNEPSNFDVVSDDLAGVLKTPRMSQRVKTKTRRGLTKSRTKDIIKALPGSPGAANKQWVDAFLGKGFRVKPEDLADELAVTPAKLAEIGHERYLHIMNGLNNGDAIQDLGLRFRNDGNKVLTSEDEIAVIGVMKSLSQEAHRLLKPVGDLGKAGMDNSMHAIEMLETLRAFTMLYKRTSSLDARRLSNTQIDVFGKTYTAPKVKEVDPLFDSGFKKLDELLVALADGSPKARLKAQKMAAQLALADGDVTKMKGIWQSFWKEGENVAFRSFYNSLLSNTETHVVNGLSSATNAWLRPLAAALGTGDFKQMRAAQWNFSQNISEAWGQAMTAMRTGEGVTDTTKKMQHSVGAEETKEALAVIAESATITGDKQLEMGVNMLKFLHGLVDNPITAWPSKLMTTTDEFMKAWTARIEFQNRTYTEALAAGDDTGKAFDESFQALLDKKRPDVFDADGAVLDPDVLRAAQEGNFQQGLEGAAKSFGQAVNDNAYLRIFFPFVKTGHNLTVFGMQHTPILARQLTEWKTTMKGTDELNKAVLRGRERLGYGLVGSAGLLYSYGNITGAPDPNATQREIQARPPYSIKIAGKWVDYSRLTPFDFPLRFVATVGDAVQKSQLNEDQAGYLMSYLAYTLSTNLTQRSVTAGLRPLGDLLNPNNVTPEKLAASLANIGNSFMPGSAARRQINNIFRPYKMEFEDQLHRLADTATFGALGDGAKHYDFLDGKPVKNLNSGMNAVLNPTNVHERGTSPGRDWLEDIQYDKNVVFKSMGGVALKPRHRAAIARKMGEMGLGKALDELIKDPSMEASRAKFIHEAQNDPDFIGSDYKEVYSFYSRTHDLVLEYRDKAKWAIMNDPEYAELGVEIRELETYKRNIRFDEQMGRPINSKTEEVQTLTKDPYRVS